MPHPSVNSDQHGNARAGPLERATPSNEKNADLAEGRLTVPSYTIHPKDVELLSAVSQQMHLTLLEFVQLAPYLYAKSLVAKEESRVAQ